VALLPDVEARLAAPKLPAHIRRRATGLHLAQRVKDLLLGRPLLLTWRTSEAELSPIPNCLTKLG
jgi:hypothetical protein